MRVAWRLGIEWVRRFGRGPGRLVLVLVLALVAACSPTPSPSALPGVTAATDLANCRALIDAADVSRPETIQAVDACRFTTQGAQAARAVLESGASDGSLWAAIWVYASAGSDPAPLRAAVANDDPSVRAMAAASLVGFGDAAGFDALRASLEDTAWLSGAEPPMRIAEFAIRTLARYVVAADAPTGPAVPEELESVRSRWIDWLGLHARDLAFDAVQAVWSVP
jgi:hypothetical protein